MMAYDGVGLICSCFNRTDRHLKESSVALPVARFETVDHFVVFVVTVNQFCLNTAYLLGWRKWQGDFPSQLIGLQCTTNQLNEC